MSGDREILREIWDGRIPVCFNLATEEVFSVDQPDPFYLLVPRQSYFPLILDKVQRYFTKHVDEEMQGELWLEYEGQPLKWHYPVGQLFDLYGVENFLPWNLTVHFQGFPEDELLHCSNKDVVESHFMSCVKEADSLKHKSQFINAMQKREHKQLWLGLLNDKFDQFWSINKKLMESSGEDIFKYIPFRIYQIDQPCIQKLFRPVSDDGDSQMLRDLINTAMPEEFDANHMTVIIQGVEPPLETPVLWLSEHFSHPDNFLHICILDQSKER